ncbi:hypothetical protein RchiOBHm_Chr4g0422491 [Rosa chinensis]|uniref:Uncharacterized protein n=1 Tax=Rosa chinensis TaxID=74649 RepID=A0A2P6QYC5_ROSCH|nr:hypothetical protein RchiOBHm_Chr4g0422491 [Rosa chinensis]
MPLSRSSFSEMARRKFQPSSLLSAAETTGPGLVRSTPLSRRLSPSTLSRFHSNRASSSHHITKKNNGFYIIDHILSLVLFLPKGQVE